jgi:hypothetical protein
VRRLPYSNRKNNKNEKISRGFTISGRVRGRIVKQPKKAKAEDKKQLCRRKNGMGIRCERAYSVLGDLL